METKNIFIKIPKQVWKIIKENGHSCTQLAKVYLTKYAEKIINEPLVIELKPKDTTSKEKSFEERKKDVEKQIEEAELDEMFEDYIEDPIPLDEGSDIPVVHSNTYKEEHETFDEKIERMAKEQKETFGSKLTKKEQYRLEQEELGKKFGKDPNKYTFEDVTPESLAKDGWSKEQITEYMKNRK
jgi:hypothetical protein